MKKNLISVLILALCFANLVLTALLIFTIIPETKKANNLIDQVCQAISLDLNSGTATSGSQLPQDQIVDYALTADDDTLTFNFAPSEDGNTHYLVCGISLSLNKKSDGYKTYGKDIVPAHQLGCHTIWIKGRQWEDKPADESICDDVITRLEDMLKFVSQNA
jgi:hypothetical protein